MYGMNLVKKVILCEVGPRDGLQNEKTLISAEDKAKLINGVVDAGYPVVEVGADKVEIYLRAEFCALLRL